MPYEPEVEYYPKTGCCMHSACADLDGLDTSLAASDTDRVPRDQRALHDCSDQSSAYGYGHAWAYVGMRWHT